MNIKRGCTLFFVLIFAAPLFAQQKYKRPEIYKKTDGKYTVYSGQPFENFEESKNPKRQKRDHMEILIAFSDKDGDMNILGIIPDGINTENAKFRLNVYTPLYPTCACFGEEKTPVFSREYAGKDVVYEEYGSTRFNLTSKGESNELNYLGDAYAFLNGILRLEIILNTNGKTYTTFMDNFYSKTSGSLTLSSGGVRVNQDSTVHIFYVKRDTLDALNNIIDENLPYYTWDDYNGEFYQYPVSKLENMLSNFSAFQTVAKIRDYMGAKNIIGQRTISGYQDHALLGPEDGSGYCAIVVETFDGTYTDGDGKTYAKTKYSDIASVYIACGEPVGIKEANAKGSVIEQVPGTNTYKTKAHRLELIDALGRILKSVEGPEKPLTIEEAGAYYLRAREKNGRVAGSKGVVKTR